MAAEKRVLPVRRSHGVSGVGGIGLMIKLWAWRRLPFRFRASPDLSLTGLLAIRLGPRGREGGAQCLLKNI